MKNMDFHGVVQVLCHVCEFLTISELKFANWAILKKIKQNFHVRKSLKSDAFCPDTSPTRARHAPDTRPTRARHAPDTRPTRAPTRARHAPDTPETPLTPDTPPTHCGHSCLDLGFFCFICLVSKMFFLHFCCFSNDNGSFILFRPFYASLENMEEKWLDQLKNGTFRFILLTCRNPWAWPHLLLKNPVFAFRIGDHTWFAKVARKRNWKPSRTKTLTRYVRFRKEKDVISWFLTSSTTPCFKHVSQTKKVTTETRRSTTCEHRKSDECGQPWHSQFGTLPRGTGENARKLSQGERRHWRSLSATWMYIAAVQATCLGLHRTCNRNSWSVGSLVSCQGIDNPIEKIDHDLLPSRHGQSWVNVKLPICN